MNISSSITITDLSSRSSTTASPTQSISIVKNDQQEAMNFNQPTTNHVGETLTVLSDDHALPAYLKQEISMGTDALDHTLGNRCILKKRTFHC